MTQFLTSHEYFKSYFHRFKRAQTTVFFGGDTGTPDDTTRYIIFDFDRWTANHRKFLM